MKLFVAILAALALCAHGKISFGTGVASYLGFGQDGKEAISNNVNVVYT